MIKVRTNREWLIYRLLLLSLLLGISLFQSAKGQCKHANYMNMNDLCNVTHSFTSSLVSSIVNEPEIERLPRYKFIFTVNHYQGLRYCNTFFSMHILVINFFIIAFDGIHFKTRNTACRTYI